MMMPTYHDDGSHASKVYQQQHQAAPPARSARRESHEGMPCSRTARGMTTGVEILGIAGISADSRMAVAGNHGHRARRGASLRDGHARGVI